MNIRAILDKYFDGVKCYVRGDGNGVWIETECMCGVSSNMSNIEIEKYS